MHHSSQNVNISNQSPFPFVEEGFFLGVPGMGNKVECCISLSGQKGCFAAGK